MRFAYGLPACVIEQAVLVHPGFMGGWVVRRYEVRRAQRIYQKRRDAVGFAKKSAARRKLRVVVFTRDCHVQYIIR